VDSSKNSSVLPGSPSRFVPIRSPRTGEITRAEPQRRGEIPDRVGFPRPRLANGQTNRETFRRNRQGGNRRFVEFDRNRWIPREFFTNLIDYLAHAPKSADQSKVKLVKILLSTYLKYGQKEKGSDAKGNSHNDERMHGYMECGGKRSATPLCYLINIYLLHWFFFGRIRATAVSALRSATALHIES
jgi:hypothetical protein